MLAVSSYKITFAVVLITSINIPWSQIDHGMLKGSDHGTQSTMVKKTLNLRHVRIVGECFMILRSGFPAEEINFQAWYKWTWQLFNTYMGTWNTMVNHGFLNAWRITAQTFLTTESAIKHSQCNFGNVIRKPSFSVNNWLRSLCTLSRLFTLN